MRKIMVVFGTRPEAIKLCPLIHELEKYPDKFGVVTCITAQHRQMLDQIIRLFNIQAEYDLDIMKENQSLFDVTTSILKLFGNVLSQESPDLLIVQGDTTTTFAASLAAFYHKIPVGHVEAGLRTHNKYSPFPEEINRKITSTIADLHFAPTVKSRDNLLHEGVNEKFIEVTGNTVIDALMWVKEKVNERDVSILSEYGISPQKKVVLITGHRRENFGQGMKNLCQALIELAGKNKNIEFVYPVHLNPNVKGPVYSLLKGFSNIKLLPPLDYEPFVQFMNECHIIISDSGGVQEEAPSLGKPVLVTRETTERPEAVEAGVVKLVGTDQKKIVSETEKLLNSDDYYRSMATPKNPYGDGKACKRIVKRILTDY